MNFANRQLSHLGHHKSKHEVIEIIHAHGHPNVQSTHKTAFQITKQPFLSKRGDCIIAVGSTKGALDLSSKFKDVAKHEKTQITITIEAGSLKEVVKAHGSARLKFAHPNDLVVRKSSYSCGRTLAINAEKAACGLSRKLVEKLRNPEQKIRIKLIVEMAT